MNLSAAQEERLSDIASLSPKCRGTAASHRALERKGLIVFNQYSWRLTNAGEAYLAAIRARRMYR